VAGRIVVEQSEDLQQMERWRDVWAAEEEGA
jgi:hypothetical protein